MKDPTATRYERLSYDQAPSRALRRDGFNRYLFVPRAQNAGAGFKMDKVGALLNIVVGQDEGTLIEEA